MSDKKTGTVRAEITCVCGFTSTRQCPDDPDEARSVFRRLFWRFVKNKIQPPIGDIKYFLRGVCEECWQLDHGDE